MQLHLEWQLNSVRGELNLLNFLLMSHSGRLHCLCNAEGKPHIGSNPIISSRCTDGYIEILEIHERSQPVLINVLMMHSISTKSFLSSVGSEQLFYTEKVLGSNPKESTKNKNQVNMKTRVIEFIPNESNGLFGLEKGVKTYIKVKKN